MTDSKLTKKLNGIPPGPATTRQEISMSPSKLSRRTLVVAGGASVTASAAGAAPVGNDPASSDPIFSALERCVASEREMYRLADLHDGVSPYPPEYRTAIDASVAARLALAKTPPTTLAGLATLARFLNHQSNEVLATSFFDEEMGELLPFFATLDRSLTAITRAAGVA